MMRPGPDLRLYHGNDLDVLAELLARELARPHPQGALSPDWVLIPQPSLRRWLQSRLSERFGIAANLELLAPGEYLRRLLQVNLDLAPSPALQPERLPWRVLKSLCAEDFRAHPSAAALSGYLQDDADGRRAWALAEASAQSFERYQAWRADWLRDWQSGGDPQDWQAELWRRVAHGQLSRAGLLGELLRRETLRAPCARLFVFACLNVSPDVLRAICRSAATAPVHLFVPTPCREYWGDLRTLQERLRERGAAAFAEDEHPLLASCGRAGREFIRLLFNELAEGASAEIEGYAEPLHQDGLLGRMRGDLLHRRAPQASTPTPRLDGSLQLHACASRLREVEVVHALIRDRLERQPDLLPRQIAVLAPDLEPYRAAFAAVFGGAREGLGFVPYQLTQTDENAPLHQAFFELLRLPDWRFDAAQIERCLSWPGWRAAVGVSQDEGLRWLEDAQRAGLRWGLDAMHRDGIDGRETNTAEDAFSWRFALRRLLLGHASGETAMLGDSASLPVWESQDLTSADALLQGLENLNRWRERLSRPRSAVAWHALLREMLADLLPERFDDEGGTAERQALLDSLAPLLRDADAELGEQSLSLALLREALQQHGDEATPRAPWLGGGVTISRMVPMRLIPYRMICLLGMDAGSFPRAETFSSINRLSGLDTKDRRLGDRDTAEDDRFLFLQLLASAERELHVSYVERSEDLGASASPLLHELQDCAMALFPAEQQEAAHRAIHLRHPDQAFETDAALPWASMRWRVGADARRQSTQDDASSWRIDAAPITRIELRTLHRFIHDPAAAFLNAALGVDGELRDERWLDTEPFAPSGLQRWQWQQRALQLYQQTGIDDAALLHRQLAAEAFLVADAGGLAEVQAWCRKLHAMPASLRLRDHRWQRQELRYDHDAWHVVGEWQGWLGEEALTLRFKEAGPSHRLRCALDTLLFTATGQARTTRLWQWQRLWRDERFVPPDAANAGEVLHRWVDLLQAHLREPLPLTADCAWAYARSLREQGDARLAWERAARAWPRLDEEEGNGHRSLSAAQRRLWENASPFEDFDSPLARRFRAAALDFVAPLYSTSDAEAER